MNAGTLGRLARLRTKLAPRCPACADWPPIGLVDDDARCPKVPRQCPACGRRPGITCIVVPAPEAATVNQPGT